MVRRSLYHDSQSRVCRLEMRCLASSGRCGSHSSGSGRRASSQGRAKPTLQTSTISRRGPSCSATDQVIAAYPAEHAGVLNVSTPTRRLAAISVAHEVRELLKPIQSPLICATLRGIRRELGSIQRQAKPHRRRAFGKGQLSRSGARRTTRKGQGVWYAKREARRVAVTWKVKSKNADGSESETLADTWSQALDLLADQRARGKDAWVEDTTGRKLTNERVCRNRSIPPRSMKGSMERVA